MKHPVNSNPDNSTMKENDVIPDHLFLPPDCEKDEEIFTMNEMPRPRNRIRHPSTLKRTKSQWEDFVSNVDVNKSLNSSIFKLTLRQLARDGEDSVLSELLTDVPDLQRKRILNSTIDDDGGTALHLAARHNHYEVCKLLIAYGSNVDSRGEGKATPLHYAAKYKPKKKSLLKSSKKSAARDVISLLASSGAHVNLTDREGQTPLHAACIKGNLHGIRQLLMVPSIDIKCTDDLGMTALHMAATHGYVEIFKLLVEKGADLHACDNDMMTPLHFACAEGNTEIVQMILEKGYEDGGIITAKRMLFRPDAGKGTCLHISVGKGHKEMVLQLLQWTKRTEDVSEFVNLPSAHNNTALHIAAAQGHSEIAEILIENGARIDARNDSLATALLLAAQYNYFNIVELLRKYKAQMETRDKDSMTPLLIASKNGNLATISWLIENGADVTATDKDDKSCLMLAVEVKKSQAVQLLLSFSSVRALLSETDKNANSVLHVAAKKGHVPLIKILVENGARIDFKNEDEATPVHIAAMYGQHSALSELLDHDKTMINSLDENANTALHLAAIDGHTRCVQILLENGANVEFRNTRQWSALDCACLKGKDSTVLELLQAQSPVNPPKLSRTTPLHQACSHGHVHVVKLLLDWKADVSARLIDGRNPLDCAIDKDHRGCVQAILQHDTWKSAMRNAYLDKFTGHITTPMRKLVVKMPDMAEVAFSRCITDNGKPLDDKHLEVTLDYEFLDDVYTVMEWIQDSSDQKVHHKKVREGLFSANNALWKTVNLKHSVLPPVPDADYIAFNDLGKPSHHAMAYAAESSELRYNHPLHIMANRKRERLLQHPVVTGLLQYKWKKYGGLVYYSSLIFLLSFVALLNIYLLTIPPPYAIDFLKSLANRRYAADFSKEQLFNYSRPKGCYNLLQSGTEYRGFMNVTASGLPCINWKDTGLNSHLLPDAGLDENYCRNPETQRGKPWCYTHFDESDTSSRESEECDIAPCPVFVKGSNVPLDATCHFPFTYLNRSYSECVPKGKDLLCPYTNEYKDITEVLGKCSKESSLCDIDPEYQSPCGSLGIDRFNCEAQGCCFAESDEDGHTAGYNCFQKRDPCSDRTIECNLHKQNGLCKTEERKMKVDCPLTCGFCEEHNETEDEPHHDDEDGDHSFLHLMSNYPPNTFEYEWRERCFYVVEGADRKWGDGCHYKQNWEDPIRVALIIFSCVNFLLLVAQVWNYKLDALRPIIFLEAVLFMLTLLLALNFNEFDIALPRQIVLEKDLYHSFIENFQSETGIRQHWQWECGAIALFLSWMDLLLYIRKIPYLGIYVVMFNDVFRTFVKFSVVFLLFILSFALTFHTLLQNGVQFEDPFKSILKTTVMMVGEIDFRETFYSKFTDYHHLLYYESVTFIIFSLFIIVMMIIIMNLLVGLAVGDIIEVKENATLERLKMQVDLALEVEFSVPNFLRKRFVRKSEAVLPNRYRKSNVFVKAVFQNQSLSSKNIVSAMNPNKSETEEIRENVSFLNHVIIGLCNKTNDVDLMVRDMMLEVRDLKNKMESTSLTPTSSSSSSSRNRASSSSLKSSSSVEEDMEKNNFFATCEEVKYAATSLLANK